MIQQRLNDETNDSNAGIPTVCVCFYCGSKFYTSRHRINKDNRVKCPWCSKKFAWLFQLFLECLPDLHNVNLSSVMIY